MSDKKISFNVSPELYDALQGVAGDLRVNKSKVLRGALIHYIHDYQVAAIATLPHPLDAEPVTPVYVKPTVQDVTRVYADPLSAEHADEQKSRR